jgi:hypothetical protein
MYYNILLQTDDTSAGQNKEESPEIYCRYYIKKLQVNLEKCKKNL